MRPVGLVATDLDGTLLDRETYDFAPARPGLDALQDRGVPLVLVSSKTRAEMERLAEEIDATGPLVVENGGAVVARRGAVAAWPSWGRAEGDRAVLVLGVTRDRLLEELPVVARTAGVEARPFAAMSVAEVALTALQVINEYSQQLSDGAVKITFKTDNRDAISTIPESAENMGYPVTVTKGDSYYIIEISGEEMTSAVFFTLTSRITVYTNESGRR